MKGGDVDRSNWIRINIGDIDEVITRRRRQILVHSIIYYEFDENIISDATYNRWANELYELQQKHPYIADICPMANIFKDFDPCTGHNLPLDTPWAVNKAQQLIRIEYERKRGGK